ncbi:1-acyl-sn-glycerol-3-phosphate acyltransferases [Chitinophaga costaii]|uniref:1-acyl-sn-glycerol-3-phosphate acyltransferases n=1 Tax=Chitinophaga costaii TaxID=1335309 RepID=A0A1C3ZGP0_9BACT|nr:trifunctional MMPL family transporter/lysophospholipid acyltransferase/class I SAM-dependent methyltransferase [Chitinophaga costaii]PUZ30365.1 methyltransferase domain-containing protein [Chitinophaga costaii]SCB81524.1 1-acyl-sn-glycerol-3-phosphate acyltransferases [Chitinophaga costaii]
MSTIFIAIYNFFERRKAWLWITTLACFAVAGVLAYRIKLEEDISQILPHEPRLDKLQQVFQDSKFADKLVLTLSAKDTVAAPQPDSLTAFAAAFTDSAAVHLSPYIKTMQAQMGDTMVLDLMDLIRGHLPVFLEPGDYTKIDSMIAPGTVKKQLAYDYRTLISPAGLVLKKAIAQDPVGISWLGVKKLQRLQYDEQFELYDSYVMTKDHRHLMIFISPAFSPNETGRNALFLQALDALLARLQQEHPAVVASYFGATAVSVGNARQLRQDTLLTQCITLLLLVILIALFFRKKRAPVLIMLPVIFGWLFSLAVVYLIKGHISVVALGAGSVVLGIAVNYSLHVFNHYRHLHNIRDVIRDLSEPMTIGSFTTIGGFLCLQFVHSSLLKDVGFFAAFSLVGAALFSLIFLPHWIVLGDKENSFVPAHQNTWLDKLSAYHPEKNKYLLIAIFALTLLFVFTARHVTFESDMMRMNFMTPALQKAEKQLNDINAYTAQSVYVVTEGNTLEAALENSEQMMPVVRRLQQEGVVKKYAGVGALLISEKEQAARIHRWHAYWTPDKQQQLLATLRQEGAAYHFSPAAFDAFEQLLHQSFVPLDQAAIDQLKAGSLHDFIIEKHGVVSVVTLLKVGGADKQKVYAALEHMPGTTVLDKQYAANRLVAVINQEFNSIAWMTSLLVFFALLLSYGRIELTLITFIPMLISWVWILGIMGLFGIRFNIVNIILSTFIFGLGDDYSIFIMDGLLQEYKTGRRQLSSFKSSIFLSAITTVLGLGVLIFAQHPSLRSIALISIIGIGSVVLISQVLIPFLFHWLITNRVRLGRMPWTLWGWTKSVFAFTYFVVGCLLMTGIGFVLIRIKIIGERRGKNVYHFLLSTFTRSLLYVMANVKKRILNPDNEDFSQPAVVISNHQSFLDILVSTMLHPKVILLTNQWVWRSPVFGAVVRLADYYPVADGAAHSIERLRQKVNEGYSIVVYPEGTRSEDPGIRRFHKGAFFIAEQLGLDILPILLHGTAYTMSKNDFLLKDGQVTVQYLPRIKQEDKTWGEGYAERTKRISRHFKQAYAQLRIATETPSYFREQLIANYRYKGPVLEWYMRIKTAMEKNYAVFNDLVPRQGDILDIGCGYGFMDYMLYFLSNERRITGIDYDEEKIQTAQNGYLRPDNLQFLEANANDLDWQSYDAIILSDVMHYLTPAQQRALLEKCLRHLRPGGRIILRDGDQDLQQRHARTRLTEFFSTRVVNFNKTAQALSFFSGTQLRATVAELGAEIVTIDHAKHTSNLIFIITHNP